MEELTTEKQNDSLVNTTNSKYQIFISYRRMDTSAQTHTLYRDLRRDFGRIVFRDVEEQNKGARLKKILSVVENAKVVLVVVGSKWSDIASEKKRSNEQDWVLDELKGAERRGIPACAVLVNGAEVPDVENLPESLRGIFRGPDAFNALLLRESDWDSDLIGIEEFLRPYVKVRSPLRNALALAASLIVGALFLFWNSSSDGPCGVPVGDWLSDVYITEPHDPQVAFSRRMPIPKEQPYLEILDKAGNRLARSEPIEISELEDSVKSDAKKLIRFRYEGARRPDHSLIYGARLHCSVTGEAISTIKENRNE